MKKDRLSFPRPLLALILLVLIAGGFGIGMQVGRIGALRSSVPEGEGQVVNKTEHEINLTSDTDFDMFWQVWNLVKEKHFDQPSSDQDMFYGAIKGMVDAIGDPYSVFFDPTDAKLFEDSLSGSFEGIGAEIGIKDHQLQIVAPLAETPAERAGLRAGDSILLIDDKETVGMSVEEAVTLIRGEKDTTVELGITRDGMEGLQTIPIVRDTIVIKSVKYEVDEKSDIATISIYTFNGDTNGLFNEAVNEILAKGAKGIILDLRNNPGGYLESAIDIASAWVGYQPVMIERTLNGERTFRGVTAPRLADVPTVVLVNGGSASASEIVAGALQDLGLAKLIGTKTFGKGSVQDYLALPDQSALKITIAHWFTPSGRGIDKEGIVPDEVVEFSQTEYEAGKDPQKDKAIEILTSAL